MNQLNSLILEGNVTRTPEFKETPHGCKICRIPIAVNRYFKNSDGQGVEEVSYFDVEVFGKLAEYCQPRTDTGRGLRVVGRLKQDRWKTTDGKNASRVTIVAEHIEFKPHLEKRSSEVTDIASATAAAQYETEPVRTAAEEATF